MAVQARREGPIDFLLAAASGAAKGAASGIEARRQREAKAAAAKAEAEDRALGRSLQQQGVDIQGMMAESLAQNRLDMLDESRRTTLSVAEKADAAKLKKASAPLTPREKEKADLDIEAQHTANKLAAKKELAFDDEQEREDAKLEIDRSRIALSRDEFDYDKLEDYSNALADMAKLELGFEADQYMAKLNAGLKSFEGRMTDDEKEFVGFNLRAVDLAMTKVTDVRLSMADNSMKLLSEFFSKRGFKMPTAIPRLVPDRRLRKGFGLFGSKKVVTPDGAKGDIPIPIEQKQVASPQAPAAPLTKPSLAPLKDILKQHPGAPAQTIPEEAAAREADNARAVFDELDRKIEELTPKQAQVVEGLSDAGQSIVADLIAEGRTTITKELRQRLLDSGLSEADVDKIEQNIKKGK